jgi:signal transduction histidine kinase
VSDPDDQDAATPAALDTTAWLGRVAVYLITVTAILSSSHDSLSAIVQVVVAGLALVAWRSAEQAARARSSRSTWLVPLSLTALACTGGIAATADHQVAGVGFAILALVGAGAELSIGWLLVVLAAGIVGIEVGAIAYDNSGIGTTLALPAVLAASALTGRYRRSYRILTEQAQALLVESERARVEHDQAAALAERARIAHEVHDVLGHSLGALGIQLQTVEALLSERGDVDGALARLGHAQRLVADGLEEVSRAVHALRADTPPLPDSLAALVAVPGAAGSPSGSLAVVGEPFALSPTANLALLRVGQEALVNVRKHATGEPATVRLTYTDRAVELTVSSRLLRRPSPTASETAGGYGLAGMHERLRLIDGSLSAGPAGDEWIVDARVPR